MNTLKVKNLKGGNKVYYFCIDCCSVIKAEVVSADWIKLNDKLYYDLYVRNEGENDTTHFLSYSGYESVVGTIDPSFEMMILGDDWELPPYTFFENVKDAVKSSNARLMERIKKNNSLLSE